MDGDFNIQSEPISGSGESLFFNIDQAFDDPVYLISLLILSVIIVLVALAFMDEGPLAKPLSGIKAAITG